MDILVFDELTFIIVVFNVVQIAKPCFNTTGSAKDWFSSADEQLNAIYQRKILYTISGQFVSMNFIAYQQKVSMICAKCLRLEVYLERIETDTTTGNVYSSKVEGTRTIGPQWTSEQRTEVTKEMIMSNWRGGLKRINYNSI